MNERVRLTNIYLKIYNKRPITADDLRFLSIYDPECFEKTCKNIVYKQADKPQVEKKSEKGGLPALIYDNSSIGIDYLIDNMDVTELKDEDFFMGLKPQEVADMIGVTYMEELFPHNDKYGFFNAAEEQSKFDSKA